MKYHNDQPDVGPTKNKIKEERHFEEIKETGDEEEEEKIELPQANDTRPIIEYDPNAKVIVSDPMKTSSGLGGHTEYKLKGVDNQGEFDITRRYKEFYMLRSLLSKNWPGFFIPSIPTKVTLGKMEVNVIQERCYLLNRFMKNISEIPFLWDSDEVRLFIRPNMSVSQWLSLIPAPTVQDLYTKIQRFIGVDENVDDITVNRYAESIRDFVINSKNIFPLLSKFNKWISELEKQRTYQLSAYKHFAEFLTQYENTTLNIYSSDTLQASKKMISDSENNNMKEQINNLSQKVSNPYIRFKYWVKEEIVDLHSLLEAISHRNSLESQKQKLENKIKKAGSDLEKLQMGKTTIKTLFKSQSSKQAMITNLTTFIAQAEKDIEVYRKIIRLVTIYLYQNVIPKFKTTKVNGYIASLKEFSDSESKNSKELFNCWSSVLEQIQRAFDK